MNTLHIYTRCRITCWVLFVGLLSAIGSTNACAEDDSIIQDRLSAQLLQNQLEPSEDLVTAYRAAFSSNDRDRFRRWQYSRHVSVGIKSTWRLVELTSDDRVLHELHRFLGFVQATTKVDPPVWWQRALETMTRQEGDMGLTCPIDDEELGRTVDSHREGIDVGGKNIVMRRDLGAIADGGSLILRMKGGAWSIPDRLCEDAGLGPADWLCAVEDRGELFIAIGSCCDGSFTIRRRAPDRSEVWRSNGWGNGPTSIGGTGFSIVWTDLVMSDECVCIFGLFGSRLFIETFDRQTGSPRLRWSSKYLFE